jgi:phage terminase large subunit-like protein
VCLPAEPKRLEGLDPKLAILDEIGVISRDTYEVMALAQGKRETSTLLGIGTPGPDPMNNVLADMRTYAAEHPEDRSFVWREFSAAGFEDHPPDCAHCWELANPALDDFLHRDALRALLPPKTREATFRRARLCQFATDTDGAFLPVGVWDGLSTGQPVPDGAEVVIALDGSFSDDTTALLVGTVAAEPLTHSGDPRLAAHVGAAVVTEDARGLRLSKASRSRSARKIDLAACLVMAHSRATWRATRRTRKKARSFR